MEAPGNTPSLCPKFSCQYRVSFGSYFFNSSGEAGLPFTAPRELDWPVSKKIFNSFAEHTEKKHRKNKKDGYPDVQDPYCLTRFTLRSPRYHLFGLRVGDTLAAAEQALAQQGYHPLQEDTGPERIRPLAYAKGPLSVSLGLSGDPERLSSLTVSIAVTNRENVVF